MARVLEDHDQAHPRMVVEHDGSYYECRSDDLEWRELDRDGERALSGRPPADVVRILDRAMREHREPRMDRLGRVLTEERFRGICEPLREAASILVENAEIAPDPRMKGTTDCYVVALDDLEALRSALRSRAL